MQYYDSYLSHHGILGQKWGVMNGPPYPLGTGEHSIKEKRLAEKTGTKVGKDSGRGSSEGLEESRNRKKQTDDASKKEQSGLTDEQKRAIKIGAAVAATALVAYGGYKLYKSGAFDSGNSTNELKEYGVKKIKGGKETIDDTVYWVNKNSLGFVEGRDQNCVSCAFATEMRFRGLDVCAKEKNGQYNPFDARAVFDRPKRFKGESVKELEQTLLSGGEGSRGIIAGAFKEKDMGIHFFNYIVQDGKVVFVDGGQGHYNPFDTIFHDDDAMNAFDFRKTQYIPDIQNVTPNKEKLMNYIEANDGGHYNFKDRSYTRSHITEDMLARDENGEINTRKIIRKGYEYTEGAKDILSTVLKKKGGK